MADVQVLRERLEAHMQGRRLKRTRQRDTIVDTFLQSDVHLSLDELLALVQVKLPGVGYATCLLYTSPSPRD